MRNKWPLIWLGLAAFCGVLLFHTSQKVNGARAEIAVLDVALAREKDALVVLGAEWSYLNAPERLEKLARAHLDLGPMTGAQFVTAADLDALRPSAVVPEKRARAKRTTPDKASPAKNAVLPPSVPPRKKEEVKKKPRERTKADTRRDYVYSPSRRAPTIPSPHPVFRDRGFRDVIQGLGVR